MNNDDDEFFEYIAIPLKYPMRCQEPTDNGQCTNEAEWQVVQNKRLGLWQPRCYLHMESLVKNYRKQQQWEQEDIEKRVLEQIPTTRIKAIRLEHVDPDTH